MSPRYALNPLVTQAAPPIAPAPWPEHDALPALDLSRGLPGLAPPAVLTAHIATLAGLADMALPAPTLGLPALRTALADDIAGCYGGSVGAEQVAITAGAGQALSLALMTILRAGDTVIVPAPAFRQHRTWLDMLGVEAIPAPFRPDRDGVPDPQQIAARLGRRTRAILLSSPNNPTGAVYPPELFELLFNLCRRHSIALILDETYRDLAGEGAPHRLFARPDWSDHLVHVYSFSAAFSLGGHRVGGLAASQNLVANLGKAMACAGGGASKIGQHAALHALTAMPAWRPYLRRIVAQRRRGLLKAIENTAYRTVAAGALFAYVEHPFDLGAKAVADLLALEQNLRTLPGSAFGGGQERYLRLSCGGVETAGMPEIARRLTAAGDLRLRARVSGSG